MEKDIICLWFWVNDCKWNRFWQWVNKQLPGLSKKGGEKYILQKINDAILRNRKIYGTLIYWTAIWVEHHKIIYLQVL